MPLSQEVLAEIQGLLRKPTEWFCIPEIRKRRPELFASEFVKKTTGEHFSVPHQPERVRRDLESFAAVLLERKLRTSEFKISRALADSAITPSPEDDAVLVSTLTHYAKTATEEIRSQVHAIVGKTDYELLGAWSKLEETGKRLASELSVTVRLEGEISRLEMVDAGHETPSDTGFAQTKIDRFYCQYSKIPHPVAAPAPVDQAIDMVHLTSQTCQLFLQQTAEEQRRLLQVLIKNAVWQDGGLRTTLFEPFEILRHSNQESTRKEKEIAGSGQDLGIWLPR
jgi:hypothetical protein